MTLNGVIALTLRYFTAINNFRGQLRTRNSSGDEIANVNFLYDDITHALQNAIDWCINSATDPSGYVLERRFTKFSEIRNATAITPFKFIQGHRFWYQSKAPIQLPISN